MYFLREVEESFSPVYTTYTVFLVVQLVISDEISLLPVKRKRE